MLNIISITTKLLNKKTINYILSLKNSHWKHSMSSQKLFFLKNIGPNDMHVMLYLKEILIDMFVLENKNFSLKMKQKLSSF